MHRPFRSPPGFAGWTGWAIAMLGLGVPAMAREKVDVINLVNGDRITGEIQGLEYGTLRVGTDSMSTVAIEWLDVVSVVSKQNFIVEDDAGGRYLGTLSDDGARGRLTVHSEVSDSSPIDLPRVTRIDPSEETFRNRLEGSFSVGFD